MVFSFLKKILFYVYMCVACMNVSALLSYSALGGQMRMSDPLKLESRMVVKCHVGAGN